MGAAAASNPSTAATPPSSHPGYRISDIHSGSPAREQVPMVPSACASVLASGGTVRTTPAASNPSATSRRHARTHMHDHTGPLAQATPVAGRVGWAECRV
eukprot:scaffold2063_cov114-Isochrysis_galbana.AAC.3